MSAETFAETMSELGGFVFFVLVLAVLWLLAEAVRRLFADRKEAKTGVAIPIFIRSVKHLTFTNAAYTYCGTRIAGTHAGDRSTRYCVTCFPRGAEQ